MRTDTFGGLTEAEIRDALVRVLKSPAFRYSVRLTGFLTFVVEATLAGNAHQIKAYTIAIEALGRDRDFDPEKDPIVRVEAGRLRQALARYYSNAGCDDPLLITLPRGTYVPSFMRRATLPADFQSASRKRAPALSGGFVGIGGQIHWLSQALTTFQNLAEFHRLQMQAVSTQIENTWQALKNAEAMMLSASDSAAERASNPAPSMQRQANLGASSASSTPPFSETAFRMLESLKAQLHGAGGLLELADTILEGIIQLHKSDFGSVQLYDEPSSELIMVAHRGFRDDMLRPFSRIDVAPDLYISGRAAHSRQPILVGDALTTDQFPFLRASAVATGYRALQATPMITTEGRLVGVMATHFAQAEASSRIDMLMTQFYARISANALAQVLPPPGHRISIDRAA